VACGADPPVESCPVLRGQLPGGKQEQRNRAGAPNSRSHVAPSRFDAA
jgi:hypothetical protein